MFCIASSEACSLGVALCASKADMRMSEACSRSLEASEAGRRDFIGVSPLPLQKPFILSGLTIFLGEEDLLLVLSVRREDR